MDFYRSLKRIAATFFAIGFRLRRTQMFWIFCAIPVLIALVVAALEIGAPGSGAETRDVFFNSMLVYYFQLMLPVLAIFSGASIVGDEVDNRTLVYLTTSSAPRPAIFLGKAIAHFAVLAIQLVSGLLLTYLLVHYDTLGRLATWTVALRYAGVTILALCAYSSLFACLGALMKKSVMIGLLFVFGWENFVQYFPGVTQRFTIIHYVKSLLPSLPRETKFLVFQLEPSSAAVSLVMLVLISAVSLAAAVLIFRQKEFILSDSI